MSRTIVILLSLIFLVSPARSDDRNSAKVFETWYQTILELVRHTPTYSPPVASRAFAYLSITTYEALATQSLAGQLNELNALPKRQVNQVYDDAIVLNAALSFAAQNYFGNTGPTGQRVLKKLSSKMQASTRLAVAPDVAKRSTDYGTAVAEHVFRWSLTDGGAQIENLGFPLTYNLNAGADKWKPTSAVRLQQAPLLPTWGKNRSFAMPNGSTCKLPPPPAYSEDANSVFYKEALDVVTARKNLSDEQKAIARFWSDDPMLSPTPPGHWVSILLQISKRDQLPIQKSAEAMARLSIAMADAFIGCWDAKFEHDLLRPVTYIRRVIDGKWEPLLITPPFPEYPSGHSTQSAAAATVLTKIFGENFAFEDATHIKDKIKPRTFNSFWAAAEEAGLSRFYGGIHFMSGVDRGMEQGRCIGAFANTLMMSSK